MIEPTAIGIIVLALLQLGNLLIMARKIFGQPEARTIQQPLQITASDCDRKHNDIERRICHVERVLENVATAKELAEVATQVRENNVTQIDSTRGLHSRVNSLIEGVAGVREAVAELKGKQLK